MIYIFAAAFVAMKVGVETFHAIQYELRMIGMPISGVSCVYRDNMLVIHNTSKPELTLKKKHNAIAYHVICKSVTMGESSKKHIRSKDNPLNPLTNVFTVKKMKHHVYIMGITTNGQVVLFLI